MGAQCTKLGCYSFWNGFCSVTTGFYVFAGLLIVLVIKVIDISIDRSIS